MLANPHSMWLYWGSDLLLLFNDASLPILGEKQEWALGQPFGRVWSEIWEDFRPLMEEVMAGKSLYFEDQAIPIAGRPTRPIGWFTYSYTPLRDESGRVQGVFCVGTETTEKVIADKSLVESMDEGFAVFETLYDEGRAYDFRFLAIN
ncbi:PAS domain-containing protein [Lysobacter korlensis]|uniref:PAS domain-containing protein n=1 Tax=Lysobacter korlensis TaxID=553636 RepID=A0ABV6RRH9_9GAMM